jgi:hypothetical protein
LQSFTFWQQKVKGFPLLSGLENPTSPEVLYKSFELSFPARSLNLKNLPTPFWKPWMRKNYKGIFFSQMWKAVSLYFLGSINLTED